MTGAVAVTGGGSGATAEVVVGGEASDGALASPAELSGRALPRRIAFGSCARQDKPQPIWDAVLASEPDLFVFLGDNIYGDTRDPTVLRAKYAQLAAQPGFKRLRERVPVLATWGLVCVCVCVLCVCVCVCAVHAERFVQSLV